MAEAVAYRLHVFPAHAGMNRPKRLRCSALRSVPRPRGDEPDYADTVYCDLLCSPPTRG